MTPGTRRQVVGAVIVDSLARPTTVLAGRRVAPPALAGRWEFPGGKVEPGETVAEALLRELHEELGVIARIGDELSTPGESAWPISERWELRLFWTEIVRGTPRAGTAHSELAWFAPDELSDVRWLASDEAAVPRVVAELASSHRG